MNIQGFFTNAASSVYGFGKDILSKGCSACFLLADKVSQVAGRFIPTAVSNTAQTYSKSFACAGGLFLGGAITHVAYRFFRGEATTRTENREIIADLNNLEALCGPADEDDAQVQQLKGDFSRMLVGLTNKYQG